MAVHKRAAAQVTTDHEQVWKWVEARSGKPAAVKATHRGKDSGVIRVILPGAPKIRGGLPNFYQDRTSKGETSLFTSWSAEEPQRTETHGDGHASRHRLS